jgi:hypothetical protein
MAPQPYNGVERRKYFRYNVIYSPKRRAKLKVDQDQFEILDFSRAGLRFLKESPVPLKRLFQGELIFSDGRRKKINAEIIWEIRNEVGIKYTWHGGHISKT